MVKTAGGGWCCVQHTRTRTHHDGLISLATKLILKDNDLLSEMAPIICYGRQATVSVRAAPPPSRERIAARARRGGQTGRSAPEEKKKVTERVNEARKKTLNAIPSGSTS